MTGLTPPGGPPRADHAAARAARRDPRRRRARAVRDRLLPPVVPAGAVGRPVPRAGLDEPRARRRRAGAARRGDRPPRHGAGREPPRRRGRRLAAEAAAGRGRPHARADAPEPRDRHVGASAEVQSRQRRHARDGDRLPRAQRRLEPPVRERDDQDRRLARRRASTSPSARSSSRASRSSRCSCAHYRFDDVGAQLFGTVGQIAAAQLKQEHYRGVRGGTIVGQSRPRVHLRPLPARHATARRACRSTRSARRRATCPTRQPVPGANLRLSLDLGLQRAGQEALATGIDLANANGNPSQGGAFVALDPRNGEVLAMGSAPSLRREPVRRDRCQQRDVRRGLRRGQRTTR